MEIMYLHYVLDQLKTHNSITSRAMFGGFGIYKDGLIVGIIIEDELYFKTDAESEKIYSALDSKPFTYDKNGKIMKMGYWKVPEDIIENREKLAELLEYAFITSMKAKKQMKIPKPKKK